MNEAVIPFVSVIIPVYNDAERLQICLKSLQDQTYPKEQYEIIVVDNGSTDSPQGIVDQFSQARMDCESKPGSYAARNKGILLAKGEVIAFTDADCIPASDWIEKGVEILLKTINCGLVAGRVDLFLHDPTQPTPVELYQKLTSFRQEAYVKNLKFGPTANVFTFKHVIDAVGLFNDSLKSGGDFEWGNRVFSAGYQQTYADGVKVAHPARRSFQELYRRQARIIGGKFDLLEKKRYSLKGFARVLLVDIRRTLNMLLLICKTDKLDGVDQRLKAMMVALFAGYVLISEKTACQLRGGSGVYR
ncbi:MAG: glycosyltransferase [Cyanobacteria bacterium RM1_2_2]|nr:glycosyltransferase [Cyanobacteria bacterium RM1_2_2]